MNRLLGGLTWRRCGTEACKERHGFSLLANVNRNGNGGSKTATAAMACTITISHCVKHSLLCIYAKLKSKPG